MWGVGGLDRGVPSVRDAGSAVSWLESKGKTEGSTSRTGSIRAPDATVSGVGSTWASGGVGFWVTFVQTVGVTGSEVGSPRVNPTGSGVGSGRTVGTIGSGVGSMRATGGRSSETQTGEVVTVYSSEVGFTAIVGLEGCGVRGRYSWVGSGSGGTYTSSDVSTTFGVGGG